MSPISDLEIDQLDLALSEIILNNTKRGDIYFLQTLTDLLRNKPQILDYSLHVDKGLKTSFILITLEKIFAYSLRYSHAIYQPYYPPTPTIVDKVKSVLNLHFPESEDDIIKVFLSLSKIKTPDVYNKIKQLYKVGESNITKADPLSMNKDFCFISDHKDPGVTASGIAELWDTKTQGEIEWDNDFLNNFPSWAKGILNGMTRTYSLYYLIQKSKFKTRILLNDVKLQPHHNLVNLLIASEYFWLYNRREVDMDKNLPLSQARIMMYGQINAISDLFVRLLPDNHPFHKSTNQRDWATERVSGTKGAQKLILRFLNYEEEIMVECSDGAVYFRQTNRTLNLDKNSKKEEKKEIISPEGKDYEIKSYPDIGIRESVLWELISLKKTDYQWRLPLVKDLDNWSKGVLSTMQSCKHLFERFIKSRDLSLMSDRGRIQPCHAVIKILIAIDYFWQFNIREVRFGAEKSFSERNQEQQEHIYLIYQEFLSLYPVEHPYHQKSKDDETSWTTQRIKGTNGASKVFLKYSGSEGEFMIETTGIMVSVKQMNQSEIVN
ncbi:MAG: hypothetical protein COB02_16960 [Candidatus Cloacimonadota bacterium]|nr:MAG: hypothetical protein COB02_16960 [Candidatus Cloacimonadota bacterium]